MPVHSFLSSRRLYIPVVPAFSSLKTAEVFKREKTLEERYERDPVRIELLMRSQEAAHCYLISVQAWSRELHST